MPIYEYKCNECGHEFEELVSSTSVETPACPKCESPDTEKMLSSFSSGASFSDSVPAAHQAGGCGSSGFS
ncbi:zinc ribbon domain-containing protein [Maridesulfovibrio sp.]|uniref:FmdB family zinc ribbon protein n=1 Tax=Maridesulfovibrio sp. TaxID=2795000 RepID=UPI0029CA9E06|nr:zinc ribbon domain-containing protein [Maridesulfovibrio sp.]